MANLPVNENLSSQWPTCVRPECTVCRQHLPDQLCALAQRSPEAVEGVMRHIHQRDCKAMGAAQQHLVWQDIPDAAGESWPLGTNDQFTRRLQQAVVARSPKATAAILSGDVAALLLTLLSLEYKSATELPRVRWVWRRMRNGVSAMDPDCVVWLCWQVQAGAQRVTWHLMYEVGDQPRHGSGSLWQMDGCGCLSLSVTAASSQGWCAARSIFQGLTDPTRTLRVCWLGRTAGAQVVLSCSFAGDAWPVTVQHLRGACGGDLDAPIRVPPLPPTPPTPPTDTDTKTATSFSGLLLFDVEERRLVLDADTRNRARLLLDARWLQRWCDRMRARARYFASELHVATSEQHSATLWDMSMQSHPPSLRITRAHSTIAGWRTNTVMNLSPHSWRTLCDLNEVTPAAATSATSATVDSDLWCSSPRPNYHSQPHSPNSPLAAAKPPIGADTDADANMNGVNDTAAAPAAPDPDADDVAAAWSPASAWHSALELFDNTVVSEQLSDVANASFEVHHEEQVPSAVPFAFSCPDLPTAPALPDSLWHEDRSVAVLLQTLALEFLGVLQTLRQPLLAQVACTSLNPPAFVASVPAPAFTSPGVVLAPASAPATSTATTTAATDRHQPNGVSSSLLPLCDPWALSGPLKPPYTRFVEESPASKWRRQRRRSNSPANRVASVPVSHSRPVPDTCIVAQPSQRTGPRHKLFGPLETAASIGADVMHEE